MGQARDEAGNIWEVDPQGNPVRLVQAAAPARGGTLMTDPFKQPKSAADTHNAQLEAELKQHQLDTINRSPPPTGYRYKGDGTLEPVPGGPSDSEDALDPATLTYYAQQVLAGAPMPAIGMGKQAAAARQAIMGEVARLGGAAGLTGADQARQIAHYKAGSGQIANLEKMAGSIGVNEQTALANGQQFLDRSAELPGQTRFAPVNAVSDWIQRRFGGTTISAADAAYNTFVNEYAKVVAGSPSGAGTLSDSARHEAMSTISGNGSLEQKQAAFTQMKADMSNRMIAIHGGINEAYKALTNQPGYDVPESTQGLATPAAQQQSAPGAVNPFAANGGGAAPGGSSPFGPGGGGAAPNQPGLTPGGSGRTFYTQRDQAVADEAQQAFVAAKQAGLAPDAVRAAVDAVAAKYGAGKFGPELDRAIASNSLGVQFTPAATGHEETGLTGAIANAIPGNVASFAGGAANAMTLGQLGHIAEATGSSEGGTDVATRALQQNGLPYFAGSLAGDVAGAMVTGGVMRGAAGTVSNPFAQAALRSPFAADTAFGAAQGAGNSDGSLGGTILGAAAGAGGNILGAKAGRLIAGARTPVGVDPLNRGERSVLGAVNDTGRDSVIDALTNASNLNAPATLADVSPQVNTLTGAAIRRSPNAAALARDTLIPRGRGQYDRMVGALGRDLGPVENIPQRSAQLGEQAQADAGPLYEQAYAAPPIGSPEIASLLSTPFGKQALSRAKTIAANERRDPMALGFGVDDAGDVVLNPANPDLHGALATARSARDEIAAQLSDVQARAGASLTPSQYTGQISDLTGRLSSADAALEGASSRVAAAPTAGTAATGPQYTTQTLDYAKRGMDDVLERFRNPITNKLVLDEQGRAENGVLRALLKETDALNPAYGQARAAYAGPASSRDALARGQDALRLSPDVLAMQVGNQSAEHLGQMRLGAQSQLAENAGRLRYSTNPFESVLGTPAMEQRLGILYADKPDDVARLLSQRDLEGQMAGSANRLIGNSMTAERAAADATFDTNPMIEAGLHGAAAVATHGASIPGTAARMLGAGIKDRIALGLGNRAVQTADQIAPIALNTDPSDTIASILALGQRQDAYRAAKSALADAGERPGSFTGSTVADALLQKYYER